MEEYLEDGCNQMFALGIRNQMYYNDSVEQKKSARG